MLEYAGDSFKGYCSEDDAEVKRVELHAHTHMVDGWGSNVVDLAKELLNGDIKL